MESVISTREEVLHFLSINPVLGDGSGDGDEYGYGYGNGDGSGDGDGYGYGDGYGSGYGDEYGNGSGYGYGSGYGDGYGNGSGYGDGDIKALNGNILDYVDSIPTIITQVCGNFAKGYMVNNDLTLSLCYIARVGNSFAHGKTIKAALLDAEMKEAKNIPIEERINKFVEVFGHLNSIHTGKRFYEWHHILTGSCQMGRDEFCKAHNIDLEKVYTVRYFLQITKDSYGGEIIKKVIEAYE